MDNVLWQVLLTGMVIGAVVGSIIALSAESLVTWLSALLSPWAAALVSRVKVKREGGDSTD